MRFRVSIVALAALVLIAGCDAADPFGNTVILTADVSTNTAGDPIRFTFNGSDLTTGRLTDIRCGCSLDIGPFLTAQGFAKTDIVSATVQSATLVLNFPISERLTFLSQAIVKLEAPGGSATEVASRSAFADVRESDLQIMAGRNVADAVSRTTFTPVMQVDPARLTPGTRYELGLALKIRLEVNAF